MKNRQEITSILEQLHQSIQLAEKAHRRLATISVDRSIDEIVATVQDFAPSASKWSMGGNLRSCGVQLGTGYMLINDYMTDDNAWAAGLWLDRDDDCEPHKYLEGDLDEVLTFARNLVSRHESLPKILFRQGARIQFARGAYKAISNYEIDLSGVTGVVVDDSDDRFSVRLDDRRDDLDEWDNCVIWEVGEQSGFTPVKPGKFSNAGNLPSTESLVRRGLAFFDIDEACLEVQNALGVTDGGLASMMLNDESWRDDFAEYVGAERSGVLKGCTDVTRCGECGQVISQ